MSDNQMAELHERLVKGKFKLDGAKAAYPFQLGWNAGLDFAMKQQRLTCDEVIEPTADDQHPPTQHEAAE